jgi:hypothetical protein
MDPKRHPWFRINGRFVLNTVVRRILFVDEQFPCGQLNSKQFQAVQLIEPFNGVREGMEATLG